jgi:hypothetical protein
MNDFPWSDPNVQLLDEAVKSDEGIEIRYVDIDYIRQYGVVDWPLCIRICGSRHSIPLKVGPGGMRNARMIELLGSIVIRCPKSLRIIKGSFCLSLGGYAISVSAILGLFWMNYLYFVISRVRLNGDAISIIIIANIVMLGLIGFGVVVGRRNHVHEAVF